MPRTPVTNTAREVRLTIRVSESERADIDRRRGSSSVSDYLRALVRRDLRGRHLEPPSSRKDAE